jgi:hypothetical protein
LLQPPQEIPVNKSLIAATVAALISVPALAQTAPASPQLDAAQQQIAALKAQLERLEATVDYLKANAQATRKEAATEALDVGNLKTAVAKYTWSGDFRYRNESIEAEGNATTRQRDRIRVRFGVLAKVNDTINAKVQLSTTNSGSDSGRSTNQTLGTSWDRKPLSIDQAYVDWKASPTLNLVLGKQPMPWTRTNSYFWDGDLTPEGAALKFARGPVFGGVYYDWINERDVGTSSSGSTDAKLFGAQLGLKKPVGKVTVTAAASYFELTGVRDRIASGSVATGAPTGTACAIDGAFGGGQGTANNSFGNVLYVPAGQFCSKLRDDYKLLQLLAAVDFTAGKFPVNVFVDYMHNGGVLSTVTDKQDTALSFGFTFNRAAAAKTWEAGVVYQKAEKNAVFGQFHDSDFGGGVTDTDGYVLKFAYVPATNWTLNATYIINQRFIDTADTTATKDYKRLQLDLNYRF